MALAPDIPTLVEMGLPALTYTNWYGLFAPRGTPNDFVDKLSAAAVEALADPAARSRLAELGYEGSRATDRRRRRSPPCKKPTPTSGGRSSRSWA